MAKEAIMQQICECGVPISDDLISSEWVSFSTPDLDGFHGIWNGAKNQHIVFDSDKKWCSLPCLIESINNYEYKDNDQK